MFSSTPSRVVQLDGQADGNRIEYGSVNSDNVEGGQYQHRLNTDSAICKQNNATSLQGNNIIGEQQGDNVGGFIADHIDIMCHG